MSRGSDPYGLPPEMRSHYQVTNESDRLSLGVGRLEFLRTLEILLRRLPEPPAVILDVGGGPGRYACRLARDGHEVHLLDPVALHVEQASRASAEQPRCRLASAIVGDARHLPYDDSRADAVLLLGPLYHLVAREDRVLALSEARRVLRTGGLVAVATISRFASTLDGVLRGFLADPEFAAIAARDLAEGQHRNPGGRPEYFTTAYFHRPEEIEPELREAGLRLEALLGVEGPGWWLHDLDARWEDPAERERLLATARALEAEPSLLGASAHLLALARAFPEGADRGAG